MSVYRKSSKVVPLTAVLCLMVAAAFGGYAVASDRATSNSLAAETSNLADVQEGASGQGTTVYACLASGKFTSVSETALTCPAQSVPVQWAAQPGQAPTPHPSPSKTPTASPSPSTLGTSCITTADQGTCGPYNYAGITAGNGYNTYVIQDVWNPISGASQTLTAYNPGTWSVTADVPTANTAVVSYPDTQQIYTTTSDTPNKLSNFSSITSDFTQSMPSAGDNEAAYDIWTGDAATGNGAEEIMIWVDDHRTTTPLGSDLGTATFDGQTFQIWDSVKKGRTGTISFLLEGNETSGTVDVLSMLKYLAGNGYIPSDSGLNQIDFGWEICSTGGAPETFTMSRYEIKSACASGSSCTQ